MRWTLLLTVWLAGCAETGYYACPPKLVAETGEYLSQRMACEARQPTPPTPQEQAQQVRRENARRRAIAAAIAEGLQAFSASMLMNQPRPVPNYNCWPNGLGGYNCQAQ